MKKTKIDKGISGLAVLFIIISLLVMHSENKALLEVENSLVVQTLKTKLSERIISLDDLTIDNLRQWKIMDYSEGSDTII